MKILFDVHCHTMSLARLAIGRYVDAFVRGGLESLYSQVASSIHHLPGMAHRGGDHGRNMLAVMENDPASLIALMEDDLSGAFRPAVEPREACLDGSGLSLFGERWDAWLICPLMMDFGAKAISGGVYYSAPPRKSVEEAVREMLAGVSGYRRLRPDGKFIVRPFLGLDPGARGPAQTERLLSRYFTGFSRRFPVSLASFRAASRWKGNPERPPRGSFAGVKLYPPLGFDPWPDGKAALDATKLLYRFCQGRRIPLVVHCDDQGYRTVPFADFMRFTDPSRWEPILEAYPDLIVDFAHFGTRYRGHGASRGEWTKQIMSLMCRYPGVHADVAYNGCDPEYWKTLRQLVDGLPGPVADTVRKRLMFRTDFIFSLLKARSYLDFVRDFTDGPLDLELKRAMMGGNPARFLFDGQASTTL